MHAKSVLILLFVFVSFSPLHAQWNFSSLENNPVDTGRNKASTNPGISSDGSGGYFIAWMKSRPAVYGAEIFLQHIDATGRKTWADTGVVVCNAVLNQYWPKVLPDGAGGALVVWQDQRPGFSNWDVYAQRINAGGVAQWTANGISVFESFSDELRPEAVSDGNGGAIVVAERSTGGGLQTDIYAQRIGADGTKRWAMNGVPVCTLPNRQEQHKLVTDGSGGVIVAWMDFRNSATNSVTDVYAQRLNAAGAALWTANGIAVCTAPYDQTELQVSTDYNHGAYVTWRDFRNSTSTANVTNLFAQRINASGTPLWTANGVAVCTAVNQQLYPALVTATEGEAIVCWADLRSGTPALYAQKIAANGQGVWQTDGIAVCTSLNFIAFPGLVPDNNNGAFVVWEDNRSGNDRNLFAQHLNAVGLPVWTANGVAVCTAPGAQVLNQPDVQVLNQPVSGDGRNGAVIVWEDSRYDPSKTGLTDIYTALLADVPGMPGILNVDAKCRHEATAKGRISNPSSTASVNVTLDGLPIAYTAADSSFTYFTSGVTTPGNHLVSARFSNYAGSVTKDTVFALNATAVPAVVVTGNTTVMQGQATTLTATVTNGGTLPVLQWQDSIGSAGWTDLAGATLPTLIYTPVLSGVKARCVLKSNAPCALPATVTASPVSFTVTTVTGLVAPAATLGIGIFPNPASSVIAINNLKPEDQWSVVEVYTTGSKQKVISKTVNGQKLVRVNVARLATGTYVAVIRSKSGKVVNSSFVKL